MYHCCCIQVLLCQHIDPRNIAAAIFAETFAPHWTALEGNGGTFWGAESPH